MERNREMINPWQDLFNAWIETLGTKEKKMKKYEVKFATTATVSVLVDANDEDEAIDVALDYIDTGDVELGEWDVMEVSRDYD